VVIEMNEKETANEPNRRMVRRSSCEYRNDDIAC